MLRGGGWSSCGIWSGSVKEFECLRRGENHAVPQSPDWTAAALFSTSCSRASSVTIASRGFTG